MLLPILSLFSVNFLKITTVFRFYANWALSHAFTRLSYCFQVFHLFFGKSSETHYSLFSLWNIFLFLDVLSAFRVTEKALNSNFNTFFTQNAEKSRWRSLRCLCVVSSYDWVVCLLVCFGSLRLEIRRYVFLLVYICLQFSLLISYIDKRLILDIIMGKWDHSWIIKCYFCDHSLSFH